MSLAQRFLDCFSSDKTRERGYHCTDLVHRCNRRNAYPYLGVRPTFDSKTRVKLRLGDILHSVKIPNASHEMTLRWNGIVGTVDAYDPNTGELLDKKLTFVYSEKRLPFPHHIKQLQYYAVLLKKNGLPINKASLLYMPAVIERTAPLDNLDAIEQELTQKKQVIDEAVKTLNIPDLYISDDCNWCPFKQRCIQDGGWPPEMLFKMGTPVRS